MQNSKLGNPAVVGLGGFGLTTLLLQFHNLGWVGLGPVLAMGIVFGGLAQMGAGLLEHKNGNNFGFAAFTAYGSFWIGLGIIWVLNHLGVHVSSGEDVGFFLIAWTLFTTILWVGSMFVHTAMFFTFSALLAGFILLDLEHFGFPALKVPAAIVLIVCALGAWYMLAAIVINDLAGRNILKVGNPLIAKK